jgi:hypothetical protein
MEDSLKDLEREVNCLRELLTRLKMEEVSLIERSYLPTFCDLQKLLNERSILQKKRKTLLFQNKDFNEKPEVQTFLDQIKGLSEKIKEQKKINSILKTNPLRENNHLREISPIRKNPLITEDENA